jgi:hypothetical protein
VVHEPLLFAKRVLVVTEREHFCVWVQQTRHKIESLPVLAQICDPSILHVLPDVFAYRLTREILCDVS